MARGQDTAGHPGRRGDWDAWHEISGSGDLTSTNTYDSNYPHTSLVQRQPRQGGHIVHLARTLPGANYEQPYTIGPFKSAKRGVIAADAFHARAEAKGEEHESVDRYRSGSAFRTLPPDVERRL